MNLLTIKQASEWASQYLNKQVTESNISYLIQYGKIKKYKNNGSSSVNINDLKTYYQIIYKYLFNIYSDEFKREVVL